MSTAEVRRYYGGGIANEELSPVSSGPAGGDSEAKDELLARLSLTVQQLRALYGLSKQLDPAEGVKRVGASLARTVMEVFRSDRAFVVVFQKEDQEEVVATSTLDGAPPFEGQGDRPRISKAVLDAVVASKQAIVSTDALKDERFDQSKSLKLMNVHSLMSAPLLSGDRCFGIIQVDDHRPGLRFGEDDLRLLVAVASMGASAIEHAHLLEAQARTIDELKHARDRLVHSEQLGIVGRTATALAHELRNQLGPLVMVDMLRRRFPEDEEVREYSEMILEAQERCLRLVEEMRAYARGQAHVIPADSLVPVDLVALVQSVVRFLRFDKECRQVPVECVAAAATLANVDSDRIKQVLINLLRNAVQAMLNGGCAQPELRILVASAEDGSCRVDVVDNGPGIPPEIRERIFEPFFTTKGSEGSGLGLDISRQILASHGGSLRCESEVGKGTTMTLEFPPLDG